MRMVVTGTDAGGTRRRYSALALVGVAVAVAVLTTACLPPPPPPKPPVLAAACANTLVATTPGTVASSSLTEISGIVASRRTAGVHWVHNDSGDTARVFAIGADGRDLGEFALSGAGAVDWEDIAAGPGPIAETKYLYLADIGDNNQVRATVQVYRVPEPLVDPTQPAGAAQTLTGVATLNFTYPDGAHDAEGFMVDPTNGQLFVVTKDLIGGVGQVYLAPANLAAGSSTVLVHVATVSLGFLHGVTGADVTPNGDVVALRTYVNVVLFPRPAGQSLAAAFSQTACEGASSASETQGEAVGFTANGRGYVTVSEGAHPALHQFVAP